MRFKARENAMSSMRGISGKPSAWLKASRLTKIAWSPVAMPVSRERQFISQAMMGSNGLVPVMVTSKRPQAFSPRARKTR